MPFPRQTFLRTGGTLLLAGFWGAATPLRAGDAAAFRTLVVVNTNSAASVELGAYYAAQHGIPPHHVCPVGLDTNRASLSTNEFNAWLRAPLTNHIATNGLADRIDFVVLCQDFPTRINNAQGLSASLFYGPRYGGTYGEYPPIPATTNAFFRAERAFRSADGWNDTNGFVAFHLVASNLPTAKLVAARGAAAQSSFPTAAIHLGMLGDQARGVREQLFANVQFSFSSLPGLPATCLFPPLYELFSGKTNVMGYQDGYPGIFDWVRTNNAWLAGAYADHMTSYGGAISNLTNATSQSTVLDWMGIGATASFGTVNEPGAYLEKFPDPLMGFYYARGFTIGEAYAMAVMAPYQGLFAGDPLAAPFAAPPVISVTSQIPYQIVTGTVPVQAAAAARSNGVPAARLDAYLDGRFHTNLAAVAPTRFNRLSVAVGGRTNTATIGTGDTLFDAVAGLADDVNGDPLQVVAARASGDRLELVYTNFDHAGDHLPVAAFVATGSASVLTLGVGLAATNLVPSAYPARATFNLYAHTNGATTLYANAGDEISCIVTLTNGVAVTNVIVASAGERLTNLTERLFTAISNSATLAATNGVRFDRLARNPPNLYPYNPFFSLFARTPGPDGAGIQVDYVVTPALTNYGLRTNGSRSTLLQDWPDDVRPRASVLFHVRPSNGVLAATADLDTTSLADGLHVLDFVARDGSGVAAESRFSLPLVVCNSSAQLSVLGTNGAPVADGEAPDAAKGTDFGLAEVGTTLTNVFAIHNNGSAALAISGWSTNGAGAAAFHVSGVPAAVAAGGVSNFTVVFAPAAPGASDARLAFTSDAVWPQTNLLLSGTGFALHLLSVQTAHGEAIPPAGLHTNGFGAVLTNSVSVPAAAGGTQFVCTGWSLADHDPGSGSGTNFTMTVTNDAALTWLWTTNYWLDTAAGPDGSVNVADSWQPAGLSTPITAVPSNHYAFTNWTGDASGTNNPLDLWMDSPKTVQANFAALLATNGTPQWWLARHGWTNDFDAAATNDAEPDGYPTWQEFVADTDPTNDASHPRMAYLETQPTNGPVLTWPASTGRLYEIQFCDDLIVGEWSGEPLGLGADTWTDTNAPPGTNRYYRVSPSLP